MMRDEVEVTNEPVCRDPNSELVWLLGQPHLQDYLEFVARKTVGGDNASPRELADEWRAANDLYHDLELKEAGAADRNDIRPLDPSLASLVDAVRADPYYRAAFDTLPASIEMVELDTLIVSQTHVANVFSEERAQALGAVPSPEALFRFCLPTERDHPPVRIQRLAAERYLFTSPSTDFRPHDPMLLLRGDELAGLGTHGPVAAALALSVGFGANFMTAIRSDGRILLDNGYHRAYTLRALGLTHAPCIVETVTRLDELRLTANESVSGDPAFYFRAKRPPMLKDFFDPKLTRRLSVRPMQTLIEVEVKVRSWNSTDLTQGQSAPEVG
jgi:hypothetical protein